MNIVKIIVNAYLYAFLHINKVILADKRTNTFNGFPKIINRGQISINKNVKLNSGLRKNPIGGQTYLLLCTNKNGKIVIDEGSGISNSALVSWDSIYIGKNVFIGGDCRIYDTDFHPIDPIERIANSNKIKTKKVFIGDGAFIGAGSIILKGSNIGSNSIIGAGSVVAGTIPPNEIWAGNPARYISGIYHE